MELQASRLRARTDASGEPTCLLDQDRSRWDHLLVRRGLAALERAGELAAPLGPYALQAAIAACRHGRAHTADETDYWPGIVALYDAEAQINADAMIVALNRAVAIGMAFGPAAALEVVDALLDEPALKSYHLLLSVRGDSAGRSSGASRRARAEFQRGGAHTRNARERDLLERRIASAGGRR